MIGVKSVLFTCVVLLLIDILWLCAPNLTERFKSSKAVQPVKPVKPAKPAKSTKIKKVDAVKDLDVVDDVDAVKDMDVLNESAVQPVKSAKAGKAAKVSKPSVNSALVVITAATLPELVKGFVSMPAKLHDRSVGMAAAIRDKLYEYAKRVSDAGADHGDPTMILLRHKDELESLRAQQPEAYAALVRMSAKGPVLTTAQTSELAALMD